MIERPATPLQEVKCVKGLYPEVGLYLEQHGCVITPQSDYDLIIFPEGTTEKECFPRTIEQRCAITLSDGTVLYRHALRARANPNENGLNLLFMGEGDLPIASAFS